jgi:soluble lytic murein transglycosylase-like protein
MSNWKAVLQGPKWAPYINVIEQSLGIPKDLLARMAYQESSFKPDVITGLVKSPAGALGILQLIPQFWSTVQGPIPFTDQDTYAQIKQAAGFLASLHDRFGDWAEALAAYNFGPGNEEKYLEHKIAGLPQETQDYVTEILADVPVPTGSMEAPA